MGYDLKNLFVGAESTLRRSEKLYWIIRPRHHPVGFISLFVRGLMMLWWYCAHQRIFEGGAFGFWDDRCVEKHILLTWWTLSFGLMVTYNTADSHFYLTHWLIEFSEPYNSNNHMKHTRIQPSLSKLHLRITTKIFLFLCFWFFNSQIYLAANHF